jgi:hypothetical protein
MMRSWRKNSINRNCLQTSSLLKNVAEAASTRQKQAKKRSLREVNEHFEPAFNAVMATQVVFQQPARAVLPLPHGNLQEGQNPMHR